MTARPSPARLMLIRHAESEGNLADLRAHETHAPRLELDARDADVELSATGRRQAAALGDWLATLDHDSRPTAVFSSPYARASSTADVIAKSLGLAGPVAQDERLRERDLGMFDGLTGLGIRDLFPEEAERRGRIGKFYYRPPGGESWATWSCASAASSDRRWPSSMISGSVVVSHQAVILNFRYVLEGLTEAEVLEIDTGPPLANCSLTTYRRNDAGTLELESFNDVEPLAHLDEPVTDRGGPR